MLQLDPDRPNWDIDACLNLIKPALPMEERDFRDALSEVETIQADFVRSGSAFSNAEAIAHQADTVAGLFRKLAPHRVGQESIDRALDSVVKNPYPAYRDVALAALGTACLSATEEGWVADRLQRILQAAFDQEGVTFTFDLAAVLACEAERRKLPSKPLSDYCARACGTVDLDAKVRLRVCRCEAEARPSA